MRKWVLFLISVLMLAFAPYWLTHAVLVLVVIMLGSFVFTSTVVFIVTGAAFWIGVITSLRARLTQRQRDNVSSEQQPPQIVVKGAEERAGLSAARNGKQPHM